MKIVRGTKNIARPIAYPVVAIGNFDGVHIGHQIIFRQAADMARKQNGTSIVFTFEPHPLKIIAPEKVPPLLNTFRQKMERIEACGIDMVVCADFTRQFADQQPRDFAKDILVDLIGVKEIVVGFDYAFGRGREGTISYLKKMGEEFHFKIHVVEPIKLKGHLVSSSHVRELIEEGNVKAARNFLGRDYSILGPVVHGHHTGHAIGFPTANLDTTKVQIPGTGVYAVRILHAGKTFRDRLSVEVHIFDFHENIYGQEVEVIFVDRIRSEMAFKSADELVVQIKKDIETARAILESDL
jgi:riboflavin kinase/FMN adenylyltransferase